jgi:hypothetical protein
VTDLTARRGPRWAGAGEGPRCRRAREIEGRRLSRAGVDIDAVHIREIEQTVTVEITKRQSGRRGNRQLGETVGARRGGVVQVDP